MWLRVPRPGDRVRLRYTSGKKPLKEVFARLHLDASQRSTWPLIVWRGEVVWMQDVVLEPDPTLPFALEVTVLEGASD
jgi:tRNA(Ile)-lysidine synthetase-like protein